MFSKILSSSIAITTLVLTSNIASAGQVIIQEGSSRARAEGANNYAASRMSQSARQNRFKNSPHNNQVILQQGRVNTQAIGRDNTVIGNIDQSARQNQSNPNGKQSTNQNASGNYVGIGRVNHVEGNSAQYSHQGK